MISRMIPGMQRMVFELAGFTVGYTMNPVWGLIRFVGGFAVIELLFQP
jgi:hypothetical protein